MVKSRLDKVFASDALMSRTLKVLPDGRLRAFPSSESRTHPEALDVALHLTVDGSFVLSRNIAGDSILPGDNLSGYVGKYLPRPPDKDMIYVTEVRRDGPNLFVNAIWM